MGEFFHICPPTHPPRGIFALLTLLSSPVPLLGAACHPNSDLGHIGWLLQWKAESPVPNGAFTLQLEAPRLPKLVGDEEVILQLPEDTSPHFDTKPI